MDGLPKVNVTSWHKDDGGFRPHRPRVPCHKQDQPIDYGRTL